METSPGLNSEAKLTLGAGASALLAFLIEALQDPTRKGMSENLVMVLMGCVTLVVISYNISRGLAKYEYRGIPPINAPSSTTNVVVPQIPPKS